MKIVKKPKIRVNNDSQTKFFFLVNCEGGEKCSGFWSLVECGIKYIKSDLIHIIVFQVNCEEEDKILDFGGLELFVQNAKHQIKEK